MIDNLAILKTTCIVYSIVFGAAGLSVLACRNMNWGRNMGMAILSWLIIFCLFIFLGYAGWYPFACLIIVLAFGAVREFYVLNKVHSTVTMIFTGLILLLMALSVAYDRHDLFYLVPLMSVFVFFTVHMCTKSFSDINRTASIQVAGLVYWGWMPMHFLLIQKLPSGFGALVVLCTMMAMNDNCAYYVGKFLGKNSPKLWPAISPGKTWVGFAGGFAGTVISALAFGYALPHMTLTNRLILGVVMAFIIPTGDLLESAMKRDLGIKDSGTIIPGHGGVMDRFDSWSFTVPLFYYVLVVFQWTQ